MQEGVAEATLKTEELQKLLDDCAIQGDEERVAYSAKQYVPIMYFVHAVATLCRLCSESLRTTAQQHAMVWSEAALASASLARVMARASFSTSSRPHSTTPVALARQTTCRSRVQRRPSQLLSSQSAWPSLQKQRVSPRLIDVAQLCSDMLVVVNMFSFGHAPKVCSRHIDVACWGSRTCPRWKNKFAFEPWSLSILIVNNISVRWQLSVYESQQHTYVVFKMKC